MAERRVGRMREPWRRRLHRFAVASLLAVVPGCYSYDTVDVATVPAGEQVRLLLDPRGLERLQELGLDEAAVRDGAVEGVLLRREGRLVLRIPIGGGVGRPRGISQELPVETREVLRAQIRRLDGVKTAVASVGAGAVSAAAVILIIRDAEGEPRLPGPGGPDDSRVPLSP